MRLLFAVLAVFAISSVATAGDAAARKPNILHIHADDFRPDAIGSLGHSLIQTPNLDSLVERGTTFTRCYTQGSMVGAVCLPSRTMLLSGRSWLRIETPAKKGGKAEKVDPTTYLPKVISAAGYETWHMGKGGNEFTAALQAFDTNIIENGNGNERVNSSRKHGDETVKFLKERKTARPFYIYLAPAVPHDPRVAEPEFIKRYKAEDVKLNAAFLPVHPFDNGEMAVRDEKLAPWPRTEANTKQQLAEYYACITGLDHHVGRIVTQLKSSGQFENTVIVFTGDNGLSMGDHGLFGKQNLYEFGGMHVPCIVAGPGIPKGKSDALVYLMDLFPTFVEMAGGTIPDRVESKSLLPILQGKAVKVRDVLYTGYRDCQRSVRDDRWKLIRYPLVNKTQLFDLQADRLELNNLADKPEHAAKVAEMTELLKKEMERYGDKVPLVVANPKPAEWTPPK